MSINHLNAGAGPVSSTTSLDSIGFSDVPKGKYKMEYKVDSPELAKLLGVKPGDKVYVANEASQKALNFLDHDNVLSGTAAKVYAGEPSWAGTVGDFLWGKEIRHN